MKILTIIGARPQFIKAATVSRVIRKYPEIKEIILHTGQHFNLNMSEIFFKEMEIPKPDYLLGINSLSHGAMIGKMLEGIEEIILKEKPDYILVYGDTNTTLAGALAAKKLHHSLVHIEAGLRSFNMKMPEEINRIVTDRISDILFCPTQNALNNLQIEGFANFDCKIFLSGDVMYDAALYYTEKAESKSKILKTLSLKKDSYILATIHREENTDNEDNLRQILEALNELNRSYPVIFPLHPRTKERLRKYDIKYNFKVIEPLGYFDMLILLKNAGIVITDSGGLQKEAFFFKKFCITTRAQTEWIELVENGYNIVAGADKEKIVFFTKENINNKIYSDLNLYGNGKASEFIIKNIIETNFKI